MSNPVLEEKLCLLENWLEEDPDDVALAQKHEEYEGLLEEVEILGKKMRKTIKLLSKNDPSKEKLERKKDQYEREFQDIVLYVQNDPFFQNQEELPPSSLLGKPLEMVMEMPGLEESIASMDFNNSQNDLRGGNLEEIRQSVHTLQKKLKKVEAMLETASFKEAKKLQKKRDQYIEEIRQEQSKLARIQEKLDNSRSNLRDGPDERRKREDLLESQLELEDDMEDQELSQDASCDMSDVQEAAMRGKALLDKEQEDTQEEEEDELPQQSRKKKHSKEYKTLKKKLEKINSLIAGSSNPKEQKKLQKKRNDYASQLDLLGENDDGDDNGVFGDSHSSMGSKSLQLSVDTELIDDEHDELEHTELRDDSPRAGKKHTKEYKTLKKKLAKIDQMIAESECNSKEQKKLQKKRNGYVSQLESLGEGEGFGDSHSSLGSKSLQLSVDTELIDDEHDELTHPQDNFQEHTELRDDSPRAGKKHTKEYKTLKKKLAKIDQMIAESECNSKEQKKLQKKRNGYVSQLESLGEGEGFGDSHSSLGSKSLQLSVDTELIDDEHDELTHPQDNFQEHTELRDDSPRAGKKHTKEYKTLKKKMAKIDQMIAESEWNSMEQKKLQKKRNGYVSQLESLGEGEGEGEGFGDSHSSMGSASISLSVEPNESEMLRIKEERLKEIRWLEAKQERLQTEMEEERRRMAKEAGFVDDNIDSERSDSDEESYDSGDEEQARLEEEDRLAEICRLEEQQRILLEEEAERQAEICRLEEGNRQKKKEEDAKTRSAPTEKHNRDDKLLRKKLKKAQQMIEEAAASKGTESKEYKKLYKKAAEYASELGETLSENNFCKSILRVHTDCKRSHCSSKPIKDVYTLYLSLISHLSTNKQISIAKEPMKNRKKAIGKLNSTN